MKPPEPDLLEVEPGVYSVLSNGISREVRILPGADGFVVDISGYRITAALADPRDAGRAASSAIGKGRQNVVAPMPGKVVRVLVEEGQRVEPGQSLIVVEAMKMQNEMKAAQAGEVTRVQARDGAAVGAGEVLLVIE